MSIFSKLFSNKNDNQFRLASPLKGRILPLSEAPDETFAQKILGDGFVVEPVDGKVISPVEGTVMQIFRTGHAVGLQTAQGLEILIHIGIDTVKMNGKGFKALVQNGQTVKKGDLLIEFDLNEVRGNAKSTLSPVVITNMDQVSSLVLKNQGSVNAGDEVLEVLLKGAGV